MIDWPSYNQKLVKRGEILFSYDFLDTWDFELEIMNKNKKGTPFVFPDSFILATSYIRCAFQLPYRQTQGIINAIVGRSLPSTSPPSYGHICKRINKLNVDIIGEEGCKTADDDDDYVMISIDSSGAKITNRGQWMDKKWKVQNRKGYLKIHIAVNIKTKEILALEVTDEKVHDSKMLKTLVDQVSNILTENSNNNNNKTIRIESVSADGAYDTNANFEYLQEKKITPGIKVRKNSIVSPKNNWLRNKEVIQQTKNLLKWKKKRKYGHRWMTETVFSTLKRTFGEYVSATKFNNMVKEMMIKVSLYNLFRRI
ncbi:MAG: IS5 family transposase [Candidatus Nitrosocosmicus sp.]|nr:IS5 family transposase [Candidatus Nitrosocosmicus sp.]MDN5866195.1 IS5 family transposase [Candidatus Nitrosocosmicus sp.]